MTDWKTIRCGFFGKVGPEHGSKAVRISVSRSQPRFASMIGSGRLKILTEFVTRESAARLSKEGAFSGVDLFSLDIDGNDYHIMAAIEALDARLIVVEYNAKFPPPHRFAMKYDENYRWDLTDQFRCITRGLGRIVARQGIFPCRVAIFPDLMPSLSELTLWMENSASH